MKQYLTRLQSIQGSAETFQRIYNAEGLRSLIRAKRRCELLEQIAASRRELVERKVLRP
ncbi:MAG: hypothetical protein V8S58_13600 [Lachnospiraceae bacterium]